MRYFVYGCAILMSFVTAGRAQAQTIHCVDPPSATPTEAACRLAIDTLARELRLTLQLRAANEAPIPNKPVSFVATSGIVRDADTTDASGYVEVTWRGAVPQEPVVITASATFDGLTTRRQIRLARREPVTRDPAYITSVAPTGGHSAYTNKYLTDPIEVQIAADPVTCNRTQVTVEYLSAGSATAPQPARVDVPALWSELDPGRFGCAAQFKWLLSSAVGEQELRAWIKRDTAFVPPVDVAGAQQYLRPRVVHAVAHPLPALVIGAAVVEGRSDSTHLPRVVGVDLSFPNLADILKHNGAEGMGKFVDHLRVFVGTNVGSSTRDIGQHVYLGVEPVVLLIGPRIADLPVGFAVGRRVGQGRDRWFGTGFINAPAAFSFVAKALGIS